MSKSRECDQPPQRLDGREHNIGKHRGVAFEPTEFLDPSQPLEGRRLGGVARGIMEPAGIVPGTNRWQLEAAREKCWGFSGRDLSGSARGNRHEFQIQSVAKTLTWTTLANATRLALIKLAEVHIDRSSHCRFDEESHCQ